MKNKMTKKINSHTYQDDILSFTLQIQEGVFWEPEEFTVMWREER